MEKVDLPKGFENALNVDPLRLSSRVDLPAEIAQRIKQMVTAHYINPGDLLPSEAKLSKVFGSGRSTIREAIKILKAENVIEIRKGIGTFVVMKPGVAKDPLGVALMDQKRVLINLMETRLLIEPNIAYLAAQRSTPENIAKLEQIMADTEQVVARRQNHLNVDIAFHNTVAESTQNDVVDRIIPIINESINAGYSVSYAMRGGFERAIRFHAEIFTAIRTGDAQAAKTAMECHLIQTMDDIIIKQNLNADTPVLSDTKSASI